MNAGQPTRSHRIWRATTWLSGITLAVAIILALGSTVWRLQQSLDLLDQPDTSAAAFEEMTSSALVRTKLGLVIGIFAAPVYLVSLIQCYRGRKAS